MEGKSKMARGLRIQGVLVLLMLVFAAPIALASTSNAVVPPPPTVTSPSASSRLPDPGKITVRGTAPAHTKVSVKVGVSHVRNGKRVEGKSVGPRGAKVSNGQWQVELGLPDMQRGWVDVRYKVTAVLYWDKRPEQHHVTDKPSAETVVEVFPQAQPEPLPTAPPRPDILTPTSNTLLKREPNFAITGTGTPGNQIHVSTRLHYAMEDRPSYEFSPHGQSNKVTVDKNGKWSTVLGYGGYTEPGQVNARVRITVKESHREDPSLFSPEIMREVPVEVPPKRAPTRAELIGNAVQLPDHVMASSQRIGSMTPAQRDALLRPMAKITSPADKSTASGTVEPKGTAAPGSNLQVSVKRVANARVRAPGKSRPSPITEDLGTFTVKTNSRGEWKVRAITLPALRNDSIDMSVVISVLEVNADGSKATPHTVTLKQGS